MGAFSAVAKSSTFFFSHKTFQTILTVIQDILRKYFNIHWICFILPSCWILKVKKKKTNQYQIKLINIYERKYNSKVHSPHRPGEKEQNSKQYKKYNKIERNYSRLYGIFMLMSAQTISMGPLLSVLYGIHKGEYKFRYPCEVV